VKISTCIACCLLLIVLACSLGAQDQGGASRSARNFVQQFYAWYVPEALKEHKGPAWDPHSNIAGQTSTIGLRDC
jgi:hypothetical protein